MLNKQTNKSNVLVNHKLSMGQEQNVVATNANATRGGIRSSTPGMREVIPPLFLLWSSLAWKE